MERQSVDEERHRRAPAFVVISVPDVGAEDHLGYLRLDAEDDELLASQSFLEALLIELVFVCREAQQALALVSHPLSRTLFPELGQIPFEGPQGLLSQIGLLLYSHSPLHPVVRSQSDRKPYIPILSESISQWLISTLRDRGAGTARPRGSGRLESRDFFFQLVDHPSERLQRQFLDMGIVLRILVDRLISHFERANRLSSDFDLKFVFQIDDTTSVMPLG